MEISAFQKARYGYVPKLPASLSGPVDRIAVEFGSRTEALSDHAEIAKIFKHTYGKPIVTFTEGKNENLGRRLKVGVILSGGQAPGGHNVIAGLFDGMRKGCPESELYGFLGGPSGLIENRAKLLSAEIIDGFRNTGGFDIIGSGRTKIETPEQFAASLKTATLLALDAIVIIGGDDSNTNAALLAEYFLENGSGIQVIGCPKTIDGDLKNRYIETSFGFDTACKTYGELIGNLARDAASARKQWHFVRLMGRAASHIALECALQTRPNVCLISEEIEARGWSLAEVVDLICDSIVARAENGENFGIILIPEGVVEFIQDVKRLIGELNEAIACNEETVAGLSSPAEQLRWFSQKISAAAFATLSAMPPGIAGEFLADRDPHGNVQVSKIRTEILLIGMVEARLRKLRQEGRYRGKFTAQSHFLGYEGRCAFPSNFDADYCYALGHAAFVLIASGLTGYLSSIRRLTSPAEEWTAGGVPLTMMMNLERRQGTFKPVIKKALVDLAGKPFAVFAAARKTWSVETCYRFPGAIQYYGPPELCDETSVTMRLEAEGGS